MSLSDKLSEGIRELKLILSKYRYNFLQISARDIQEYFSYETTSGDVTIISNIIENKWLLLHEIVELSELKKTIQVNENIFKEHIEEVMDAHITATEWEFQIASGEGDHEWIQKRKKLVEMWIRVNNLSKAQTIRYQNILEKF